MKSPLSPAERYHKRRIRNAEYALKRYQPKTHKDENGKPLCGKEGATALHKRWSSVRCKTCLTLQNQRH